MLARMLLAVALVWALADATSHGADVASAFLLVLVLAASLAAAREGEREREAEAERARRRSAPSGPG
jgi:uncharacterized membrane protein